MGSKSDYLENKLLDHVLGGPDYVRPATVYIALYTVAPTDAGGGTEVSGGSYSRAALTNNATSFPNSSGGNKSNAIDVVFSTATADWGTVVAFAILDAASGGNFMYWGTLGTPKAINSGDTAVFRAGDIDVIED